MKLVIHIYEENLILTPLKWCFTVHFVKNKSKQMHDVDGTCNMMVHIEKVKIRKALVIAICKQIGKKLVVVKYTFFFFEY